MAVGASSTSEPKLLRVWRQSRYTAAMRAGSLKGMYRSFRASTRLAPHPIGSGKSRRRKRGGKRLL